MIDLVCILKKKKCGWRGGGESGFGKESRVVACGVGLGYCNISIITIS